MRTVILCGILSLMLSYDLLACSCGGFPSADEAQNKATVVFQGTVVRKWPVLLRLPKPFDEDFTPVARWTFDVSRSWKGTGNTVTVLQLPHNCSNIFALGKEYVVFAYPHEIVEGALASHKCGSPNLDENAILTALGRPSNVYPDQQEVESNLRVSLRHWYTYGITGIAAVLSLPLGEPWLKGVPIVVVLAACCLAVVFALLYAAKRRRLMGVLAVVFLLIALSTVFVLGYHYSHDPWFAHLVEYDCQGCVEG